MTEKSEMPSGVKVSLISRRWSKVKIEEIVNWCTKHILLFSYGVNLHRVEGKIKKINKLNLQNQPN